MKLEDTLVHHNLSLLSLNAPNVDWSFIEDDTSLDRIHRSIIANQWMNSPRRQEKDPRIEEIISIKMNPTCNSYSLYTDSINEFAQPKVVSEISELKAEMSAGLALLGRRLDSMERRNSEQEARTARIEE